VCAAWCACTATVTVATATPACQCATWLGLCARPQQCACVRQGGGAVTRAAVYVRRARRTPRRGNSTACACVRSARPVFSDTCLGSNYCVYDNGGSSSRGTSDLSVSADSSDGSTASVNAGDTQPTQVLIQVRNERRYSCPCTLAALIDRHDANSARSSRSNCQDAARSVQRRVCMTLHMPHVPH
jgi:hypothetical protein